MRRLVLGGLLVLGCQREPNTAGPIPIGGASATPIATTTAPPPPPVGKGKPAPPFQDAADPVVALSSGDGHNCALRKSGHVDCWGSNGSGELGATSVGGAHDISAVPVRVEGIDDATAIGAGGNWSCAVRKTGTVVCWGGGRLVETGKSSGPGPVDTTTLETIPQMTVSGLDDAVSVSVGTPFSCAIRRTGAVSCFSTTPVTRPKALVATAVPGAANAAEIVLERADSYMQIACLRQTDGSLACFTDDPGRNKPFALTAPAAVPGFAAVTSFSMLSRPRSNSMRGCASHKDGSADCLDIIWPLTPHGRSGSKLEYGTRSPLAVKGAAQIAVLSSGPCTRQESGAIDCAPAKGVVTRAKILGGAGEHACALADDGRIACWGNGRFGRTGRSTTIGSSAVSPVLVANVKGTQVVGTGPGFSCFGSASGVSCVGDTTYAYSWMGERRPRFWAKPTKVLDAPVREMYLTEVSACALGDRFSCWGLVDNDRISDKPVDMGASAKLHGLTTTGLGGCALDPSGAASCWGQVTAGDGSEPVDKVPFPGRPVFAKAKVAQIASNEGEYCVLESSPGPVSCWRGHLNDGALASGAQRKGERIAGVTDAVEVAVGPGACVRHATGAVSCWSTRGTSEKQPPVPSPRKMEGLADVTSLKAGGQAMCALRKGGQVSCWGMPNIAQPSAPWRTTEEPMPIEMPPARSIAVGWTEACAIARDADEVRCWGENDKGQLGDGSTPDDAALVWLP